MRRTIVSLTVGVAFMCPVRATYLQAKDAKGKAPLSAKEGSETGCHGTSIDFVGTPSQAAKEAKKQEKLVFVLHVSGNFEDPRFT
ncbi:MAG: hypothetical protein ACJ8FY_23470 [Gemmataceae bacterium]